MLDSKTRALASTVATLLLSGCTFAVPASSVEREERERDEASAPSASSEESPAAASKAPRSAPVALPESELAAAEAPAPGSTPAPAAPFVKAPEVIFSATRDGAAATTLGAASTLHGRVENASATARGCMELVGRDDGYCAVSANWTTLPNADWSYDASAKKWRAAIAGNTFPGGRYKMFFEDGASKLTSTPVVLELTAPTCGWTSGFVIGPIPAPSTPCTAANAGSTAVSYGATFTCTCR